MIAFSNVPMCPSCNHEMTDDEMHASEQDLWSIAPNEERVNIICPNCFTEYHCQGGYVPTYKSSQDEDEL